MVEMQNRNEPRLITDQTPIEIRKAAKEQFHSEVGDLLLEHRGRWVAYHGAARLNDTPTETKTELVKQYSNLDRNNQLYVRQINPVIKQHHFESVSLDFSFSDVH